MLVITPQFDVSVVPPNMAKSSSNGVSVCRPQGYDDKWRYYPGYDASFDDDYRRQRDQYKDDFDRRSVHSEQSAHSLHSSQSHRSRRSSFSSRSQQVCVYMDLRKTVVISFQCWYFFIGY